MQIMFDPSTLADTFVVYRLDMLPKGEPKWYSVYVGVERLKDIFRLRDAHQNSFCRERYHSCERICISVVSEHRTQEEAMAARDVAAHALQLPGNSTHASVNHSRAAAPVRRSDGAIFPSIRDAAEAIGAPSTSISAHLSGRRGYRTVKGYHFERIG